MAEMKTPLDVEGRPAITSSPSKPKLFRKLFSKKISGFHSPSSTNVGNVIGAVGGAVGGASGASVAGSAYTSSTGNKSNVSAKTNKTSCSNRSNRSHNSMNRHGEKQIAVIVEESTARDPDDEDEVDDERQHLQQHLREPRREPREPPAYALEPPDNEDGDENNCGNDDDERNNDPDERDDNWYRKSARNTPHSQQFQQTAAAIEQEISALNDKGNEFFAKNEYDAALRMYSEALKLLKNSKFDHSESFNGSSGMDDPNGTSGMDGIDGVGMRRFRTARLLVNIGAVHIRRQDYNHAINVLELSLRSSNLVPERSTYYYRSCEVAADALENMGLVLYKQGEFERSESRYSEGLGARRKCLRILNDNYKKGGGQKSRKEMTKFKQETSACKLELANTLFYMALLQEKKGEISQAISKCEEAVGLRRQVFPKTIVGLGEKADTNALNLYSTIARLYCHADAGGGTNVGSCNSGSNVEGPKYQDALGYFHEVHRMKCELLGRNHIEVASTLNNIAFIYMQLEEYTKCISISDKAIEIATNGRGLNKESCIAWGNKGEAYALMALKASMKSDTNKYNKEAIRCLNKALELQITYLGEHDPMNAGVHEKLANVYFNQLDYENAMTSMEDCIFIQREVLDANDTQLAVLYSKLGSYHVADEKYLQQNDQEYYPDFNNAVQCHTKALRIYKQIGHNNDKNGNEAREGLEGAAREHNAIGGILKQSHNIDDRQKAMEHYMASLHYAREAKLPSSDAIVSDTIRNVASFQKR